MAVGVGILVGVKLEVEEYKYLGCNSEGCVFSSTLIRLNKDAFEGHLCQTVNNFVKHNKSSLLWERGVHPNHIKHIRNTRVSRIPTFDEPCSSTLHPLNFVTVVFLVWVPNSGAILHKRANQRKVSRLRKLLWAALQVATQKRKLGVSLVCHGCNVFWPLQVVTESYPQVLSVHDFLQYLSCQWVVEKFRVACPWHSHNVALGSVKTHTPCVGTWKSVFSVPPYSALVTVCMYNGCQTTYFRKLWFSLANIFYFPYIYLKHVGEVTNYKIIYLFVTSANFVLLF